MNHLAHIFLSCHDEHLLLGNFIADFLTTKEIKLLSPYLHQGINLHKTIDQYTDQHADVKKCIEILRPTQKKYTPVVVDILFDYFLIKNWSHFCNEPLDSFKERIYHQLASNANLLPEKIRVLLPKMIEDDFLMSCRNEERLKKTFERLSRRTHFPHNFGLVIDDLRANHNTLNHLFMSFFPNLILFVQPYCECK